MKIFSKEQLKGIYRPADESQGEQNGQVTVIGGSSLFHGAPLLSLKVASRVVDMVFFATPEKSVGRVAEKLKSKLSSFIWVPWEESEKYIEKSDAVLIGPGFMRYKSEKQQVTSDKLDEEGKKTRKITQRLLTRFPDKKWVIDAGSLQVMDKDWIPQGAILTPNLKEFDLLFESNISKFDFSDKEDLKKASRLVTFKAHKHKCTIVCKAPTTIVCTLDKCMLIPGGNAGLTKGGTGDVLAGLVTALYAKNYAFLSATTASYIVKTTADELHKKVETNYNSDDLANAIPEVFGRLTNL